MTEVHAIFQFSSATTNELKGLKGTIVAALTKEGKFAEAKDIAGCVLDVQPHRTWPINPDDEQSEVDGRLKAERRASIFVYGRTATEAGNNVTAIYHALNRMAGYGCEVAERYELKGNHYKRVA